MHNSSLGAAPIALRSLWLVGAIAAFGLAGLVAITALTARSGMETGPALAASGIAAVLLWGLLCLLVRSALLGVIAHVRRESTGPAPMEIAQDRVGRALAKAVRDNEIVSVLFIAADQYEECRRALGEAASEAVDAEIAQHLSQVVRDEEAAIRIGPNRHLMVLSHPDGEDVVRLVTSRIHAHFAQVLHLAGENVSVTLSIGVSEDAEAMSQPDALIRSAGVALAEAIARGGNTTERYRVELDDLTQARTRIARDFRRAVAHNDQLALVYQPVYSLPDRKLIGAEALLRWNHPVHGRLSASFIINLAAETGTLEALTRWSAERGLEDARRAGLKSLTLNLSLDQLESPLIQAFLRGLDPVGQYGVALVLDIPARALGRPSALEGIASLQAAGLSVCVDGLEATSPPASTAGEDDVPVLRRYKLDATALADDASVAAGLENRLYHLRDEGFIVAAKNVETADQASILSRAGVVEAQGRFFCMPVTAHTLRQMARQPQRGRGGSAAAHP